MSTPRTHQAHAVYFRQRWADEWIAAPRVYCDQFSEVAGPDVSEATLTFLYGPIQSANVQFLSARSPYEVNGWYVKIVLNQFTEDDDETVRTWYGTIVETQTLRSGHVVWDDQQVESGTQTFQCRGMEFLLQRTTVDSSFVLDKDSVEIEIGRAIAFNLGPGRETDHARLGNKSSFLGGRNACIFAFGIAVGGSIEDQPGKTWSVQDIIEYLFAYHPPIDSSGTDQLHWAAADGGDAEILTKLFPTAHAEGKTVKQLLDELIDRRRLVGYTIDVVGDPPHPKLNVFTFNATDLTLPSGLTVPANSNQQTWHFDNDLSIKSGIVAEDDATRFDQVIARGEPLASCLSVGNSTDFNATLVKDWGDTLVTAFNKGASTSGSYAGLASIDKIAANQAFRADDQFAKVFRAVLLSPDFDGFWDEGVPVCPDPTKEGEDLEPSTESTPFWYPGLKFLDRLPLRTDYDYSTVDDFETTSLTIDSSQPNYLRPFAVFSIDNPEFDATDPDSIEAFYYRMDRPGGSKLTVDLLPSSGRAWAASLRVQDGCPGLLIDVQGAPQQVIAKNEFVPVDKEDEKDWDAEVRWQDIICTVFLEFDQRVEARYPQDLPDTDVVRELIIDVPNARLDYLVPDTVIGVDDEAQLLTTDGGYVRDDRALLQDIARSAHAWYGHTRKAITVVQNNLVCDHSIGELITTIGTDDEPVEVNSVVTKIVFDIKAGNVTVFTQYAELDPLRSGAS